MSIPWSPSPVQFRFTSDSKPKVFVCHASEDTKVAADIANRLLTDGFPVWLDKLCLLPGQDWEKMIAEGVDSAQAIIVLISEHFVKTGYLQKEVRLALAQADRRPEGAIFILPLLIDDTPPPPRFSRWQWVRMEGHWFDDIRAALGLNTTRSTTGNFLDLDDPVGLPSVVLSHVRRGPEGSVDFIIDLKAGDNRPVYLGASVLAASGEEHFDERMDRRVALRSGIAAYRRYIPSPHQNGDLLALALWSRRRYRRMPS